MSQSSQLFMRKPTLTDLPALYAAIGPLADGLYLHTHRPGDETAWEALMERCFQMPLSYADCIRASREYHPSRVFYLSKDGEDIAVAAAVVNPTFPDEGWLHFVGVDPADRGLGLSYQVVLAALFSFYA